MDHEETMQRSTTNFLVDTLIDLPSISCYYFVCKYCGIESEIQSLQFENLPGLKKKENMGDLELTLSH